MQQFCPFSLCHRASIFTLRVQLKKHGCQQGHRHTWLARSPAPSRVTEWQVIQTLRVKMSLASWIIKLYLSQLHQVPQILIQSLLLCIRLLHSRAEPTFPEATRRRCKISAIFFSVDRPRTVSWLRTFDIGSFAVCSMSLAWRTWSNRHFTDRLRRPQNPSSDVGTIKEASYSFGPVGLTSEPHSLVTPFLRCKLATYPL